MVYQESRRLVASACVDRCAVSRKLIDYDISKAFGIAGLGRRREISWNVHMKALRLDKTDVLTKGQHAQPRGTDVNRLCFRNRLPPIPVEGNVFECATGFWKEGLAIPLNSDSAERCALKARDYAPLPIGPSRDQECWCADSDGEKQSQK